VIAGAWFHPGVGYPLARSALLTGLYARPEATPRSSTDRGW
jgi:hypothetical protein